MNRSLISRLYGVSRASLIRWENAGTLTDRLAALGIACYPRRIERLSVDWERLDSLPRDLTPDEREWFQTAYSYPGGPVMDPRPRKGAPKGMYYDEEEGNWFPRPYSRIPG
jgi:hypothetical protein